MSLHFYLYATVDLGGESPEVFDVYCCNITHNLAPMAAEAGVYACLWHPEETQTAGDIVPLLHKALIMMRVDPERFQRHNPANGWGSYHSFLNQIIVIRDACAKHPKAKLRACK
jgi:hypothetical protein